MKHLIAAFLFCLISLSSNIYAQRNTNTNFTTVYTNLNRACEVNEGGEGQDPIYDCRGVGGYRIINASAAAATYYTLKFPEGDSIQIAIQNFDYQHSKFKAEWRHANGKPFALIMRFYQYSKSKDEYSQFGKKNGEYLKVLGLKGFENINFEVDATTPNANQKARDLADNGYKQKTAGSANNSDRVIIFDMNAGGVLGTYKYGRFGSGDYVYKSIKPTDSFKLFGLGMKQRSLQYKELESAKGLSGVALSSNINWDPVPRKTEVLNLNSKTYEKIVRDIAIKKGISKPDVMIHQILRVDLEGDGQDEVIIAAGSDAPKDTNAYAKGSYALLMVRKIVSGKVRNIMLDSWFNTTQPDEVFLHKGITFEVTGVLDLDADGRMEIVAYQDEHESFGSVVHKINGEKSIKVLESFSGV